MRPERGKGAAGDARSATKGRSMVHVITDDTFEDEVVKSDLPCVIGFTAGWCNLCPQMLEALEEVSDRYAGKVKFCTVNVDEQRRLRILFAVAALPYTVYVADDTKTPLFDELVNADRLDERLRFVLDGGKCPSTTPLGKMR